MKKKIKKILLDELNDLKIELKRDSTGKITQGITLGDTLMQDAYLALSSLQGECKDDPIVGCNLFRKVRGKAHSLEASTLEAPSLITPPLVGGGGGVAAKKEIKLALKRIGIKFEDIKDKLTINTNGKQL